MTFFSLIGPPDIAQLKKEKDVEGLIKSLLYRNEIILRRNAAEALGDIGDQRAVEPLIAVLRDEDDFLGENASRALGKIKDVRAVEPLIVVVQDKKSHIRGVAINALGDIGDQRAVEPLIAILSDKTEILRVNAGYALGRIGDTRAVDPLLTTLKEQYKDGQSDPLVTKSVVEALGEIRSPQSVYPLIIAGSHLSYTNRLEIKIVLGKFGLTLLDPLFKALSDKDVKVRQFSAELLGESGASLAVQPLIVALKDDDKSVRYEAAFALGKIGDSKAIPPLVNALMDEDFSVMDQVAISLDKLGWTPDSDENYIRFWFTKRKWDTCVARGPRAVDPLIKLLQNKSEFAREKACSLLGTIGDKRAVDPLIEALKDTDISVRKAAAVALGEISDPSAVDPLIAALKRTDEEIVIEERNPGVSIYKSGPGGSTSSLDHVQMEIYLIGALSSIGLPAQEKLINALKDEDYAVRNNASKALKGMGWIPSLDGDGARYWIGQLDWEKVVAIGPQAVKPLIASLQFKFDTHRRPHPQYGPIIALGKIGDRTAVDCLAEALKDDDSGVRFYAAEALGNIGDVRSVDTLIKIFRNEHDSNVKKAVAKALIQIGSPAVDSLISALNDESWSVRSNVATILGHIGDVRAIEPLKGAFKDSNRLVRESVAIALNQINTSQILKSH